MKIKFCSLGKKDTFQEYLMECFGASKSQLKKWGLPKKYLSRSVEPRDLWEIPVEIVNRGLIAPFYSGPPIKILGDCSCFTALSKPFDLHCHPLKYKDQNNVLSWCRAHGHREVLNINPPHYDRGLAYRLDYGTSGVLILIKNPSLHHWIRGHYREACKQKKYLALIKGPFEGGRFIHHLDFSSKKVRASKKGSMAQIEVKTLYLEEEYSLVEICLKEGHRHQIRAQMSLLGHPLVGDQLYGGDSAERLFLHAYHYCLETPWGKVDVKDTNLASFGLFLDLNRALEVLGDEFFIFESGELGH